jgi:cell division septation protein DedD
MMVTVRTRTLFSALFLVALLGACSREQEDWRAAERADTIGSYGQFLEHHPESELTTQARTRIAQLGEDRDWQEANGRDSGDAYRQFLDKHPNGKWSQEARIRMENYAMGQMRSAERSARAWSNTAAVAPPAVAPAVAPAPASTIAPAPPSTTAAAPAPALAAVTPTGSAAVPTAVAATAGYGIQLGAFSSAEKADAQWQLMASRFGSQLQGLTSHVVAADTPQGRIYRLQADVGDESRSRAICEALREQSQPCVPVIPR